MDREVEALAKETMLAVDRAEQQAQETVRHAQEEAQRLRQDAAAKGQQLIEAAEKEAQKRAGILYGVAKADGEKRKAAIQRECQEEQEQLQALDRSRRTCLAYWLKETYLNELCRGKATVQTAASRQNHTSTENGKN